MTPDGPAAEQSRATRVLVVEDEPLNRELISATLRVSGYDTVGAEDGQAGWEILEAAPEDFDVIVLDRRMPRLDGMALLARLKADERLKHIPVIMQTGLTSPEEVIEGVAAGVYYYLAKPLERRLLLSVVAAAVEDGLRIRRLLHDLDRRTTALTLMQRGRFTIRTLSEANTLAVSLARACLRSRFMVIGLSEIFTNAIEHGNLGITYAEKERLIADKRLAQEIEARLDLPENRNKVVTVSFERRPDEVRITVRDEGRGFDWRPFIDLDPSRAFAAHGRGIAMARRLAFDQLEYRDPGNEVTCISRIDSAVSVPAPPSTLSIPAPDPVPFHGSAELRLASTMQLELLPRTEQLGRIERRSGLLVTGFHQSSSDLGGDLWGTHLLDNRLLSIWLADFSGHGLASALNTFRLHALIGSLDEVKHRPGPFLAELNRQLAGVLPVGQYATMLYGVVDMEAGQFRYAAAAAPPPVVVSVATAKTEVGDGSGLPLGVVPSAAYSERILPVGPGSVLVMASDGLSENPRDDGTSLGPAGVVALLQAAAGHGNPTPDIQTVLTPFLAKVRRPLRDDLTAVCCSWPGEMSHTSCRRNT